MNSGCLLEIHKLVFGSYKASVVIENIWGRAYILESYESRVFSKKIWSIFN